MEWVETTGRTVEDAKEAALDELGVDEQDAEFEVLEEAKVGLFGRLRAEARVRARVKPTAPRAKDDRRGRRRRRPNEGGPTLNGDDAADAATAPDTQPAGPASVPTPSMSPRTPAAGSDSEQPSSTPSRARRNPSRAGSRTSRPADRPPGDGLTVGGGSSGASSNRHQGEDSAMEVSLEEQGQVAQEFLHGLIKEMGLEADIAVDVPNEDTVEIGLSGDDLGALIGPKGATLLAMQDLTRTVVQRRTGASNGRLMVDVGGYRKKRADALARFARKIAADVVGSGTRRAMEPMSAADRKVVHDALTDVDGVETTSEGEDPQRRVIVLPVVSEPERSGRDPV